MSLFPGSSRPPATLVDLIRERALEAPEDLLFSWLHDTDAGGEIRLTRGELDRLARALAARLQDRKLSGSMAILLFPPGLETIVSFFGCLLAGVIAVPAHVPRPNRPMGRLRSIAADAAPRAPPDLPVAPGEHGSLVRGGARTEETWSSSSSTRLRAPTTRMRGGGKSPAWVPTRSPSSSTPRARPPTPEGGDGHPRQPAAQLGGDPPTASARRPDEPGRVLAAALPRHGPDRRACSRRSTAGARAR